VLGNKIDVEENKRVVHLRLELKQEKNAHKFYRFPPNAP
jgi:hypothetical protein